MTRHSHESMSRTPIRDGKLHPLSTMWRGGRGVRPAPSQRLQFREHLGETVRQQVTMPRRVVVADYPRLCALS